jgi:probable HAF family extracellular repeat protein
MFFPAKWFRPPPSGSRPGRRPARRPAVEALEDRCLLSYSVTILPPLAAGSTTVVEALNNAGQAVGQNDGPNGTTAVLWQNGQAFPILNTLGGTQSCEPSDINDSGQVVGTADTGNGYHAFLWTPAVANGTTGSMIDLQVYTGFNTSSYARINKQGVVIGIRWDASGHEIPFVYQNGLSADLGQLLPAGSGWDLRWANDINGNEIVGQGRQPRGQVLRPRPEAQEGVEGRVAGPLRRPEGEFLPPARRGRHVVAPRPDLRGHAS